WISDWGIAGFVDAGDAADTFADLKPALGVGAGARLRTPAGPLAIDLAWGERLRQWRLQFAVTLAF
ncbi:MAG: outer membrane protein assembly factor, partial [Burkholderiaceae bacterium]